MYASVVVAIPINGEEGAKFANEAISQAQQSLLIPRDAIIHNVTNIILLNSRCKSNIYLG